jgi:hypothetical protein
MLTLDAEKSPKSWRSTLALALSLVFLSTAAHAQQPTEDPVKRPRMDTSLPAQAPPNMVKQQGQPFYLQGAVVALLTGGAVWTVCRSSRRQ